MDNDPVLALTQQVERDGAMLVFIKPGRTAPNTFIERCNRMHRTEY
jgi:putative transposase